MELGPGKLSIFFQLDAFLHLSHPILCVFLSSPLQINWGAMKHGFPFEHRVVQKDDAEQ